MLKASSESSWIYQYLNDIDVSKYDYLALTYYSQNSSLDHIEVTGGATCVYGGTWQQHLHIYDVKNINKVSVTMVGTNQGGMSSISCAFGF